MQVREAKDFLVQETAKQASLEGVPLSELNYVVLPWILKRPPMRIGELLLRLFRIGTKENRNEREGLP